MPVILVACLTSRHGQPCVAMMMQKQCWSMSRTSLPLHCLCMMQPVCPLPMYIASFISSKQVRLECTSMQGSDGAAMCIPGALCLGKLTRHNLAGVDCNLAATRCRTAACQSPTTVMHRLYLRHIICNALSTCMQRCHLSNCTCTEGTKL